MISAADLRRSLKESQRKHDEAIERESEKILISVGSAIQKACSSDPYKKFIDFEFAPGYPPKAIDLARKAMHDLGYTVNNARQADPDSFRSTFRKDKVQIRWGVA